MRRLTFLSGITIAVLALFLPHVARATASIGGAEAATDEDWPAGSLAVANHPSRSHSFEAMGISIFYGAGDAATLNDVLAKFAKVQAPGLKLVIRAGVTAFDPSEFNGGAVDHHIAWSFSVWTPGAYYDIWSHLQPSSKNADDGDRVPAPELAVWPATPGLDWAKVHIPAGLAVTDERAIGHGYTPADGAVVPGVAYDMLTSKPVPHCQVVAERYAEVDGHPAYSEIAHTTADASGNFEIKNFPVGTCTVLGRAPGYASRVLASFDCQPGSFHPCTARLLPAITQTGVVLDKNGKPIANLSIHIIKLTAVDNSDYRMSTESDTEVTTDAAGRFTLADYPSGCGVQLVAQAAHAKTYHPLGTVGISATAQTLTYAP